MRKISINLYPKSRAFLLECTELPPYADAIRFETGLPVFDAITMCNSFIDAFRDNVRFGKQEWQHEWDGKQEDYDYGTELTEDEKQELVNKSHPVNKFKRLIMNVLKSDPIV